MLVIHVINGRIYAMKYSVMDSKMERISLEEAVQMLNAEVTP